MEKRLAKIALALMTLALFVMTAHIFEHAFSASPSDVIQCRFCQNLAGISAPSGPVVAPPQIITPEEPRFTVFSAPLLSSDTKPARAPPTA